MTPPPLPHSHRPRPSAVWLPGARLNIAGAALNSPRAPPGAPAILWAAEGAPRAVVAVGRDELRARVARAASCVAARWPPGAALALALPMSAESVVLYLAIVAAGCSVVSIADSFAAGEIGARLRIARAAGVFTQDVVLRGGKALPLYARVAEAGAPPAVVLPADGGGAPLRLPLREGDASYASFLGGPGGSAAEAAAFAPRVCDAGDTTNILFSSGTTVRGRGCPRWGRGAGVGQLAACGGRVARARGAPRATRVAPPPPHTAPTPPPPAATLVRPRPRASPRPSPGAT